VKRILVTFALKSEVAPWRRASGFKQVSDSGIPVYLMRTGDAEIYAAVTGIGARSVESELRDLFRKSADVCIASGLAGSLRKEHHAGTVLAARVVTSIDGQQEIKADNALVDLARESGASIASCFLTSRVVVNSPDEKSRLGQIAEAVDMESFQVFQEASKYGIPAVAIRAISDAAETELPMDFNRLIDDRGRIGWLPAVYQVARAPQRTPEWIRFGLESSRARRNLASFLDRYIHCLIANRHLRLAEIQGAEPAETK
jgi:adenosylhomocysteine nucleosidase